MRIHDRWVIRLLFVLVPLRVAGEDMRWKTTPSDISLAITGAHRVEPDITRFELEMRNNGSESYRYRHGGHNHGYHGIIWSQRGEPLLLESRYGVSFNMMRLFLRPDETRAYNNMEVVIPKNCPFPFPVQVSREVAGHIVVSPVVIVSEAPDGQGLALAAVPAGGIPAEPRRPGLLDSKAVVWESGEKNFRTLFYLLERFSGTDTGEPSPSYPESLDAFIRFVVKNHSRYMGEDKQFPFWNDWNQPLLVTPARRTIDGTWGDYALAPAGLFADDGPIPGPSRVVLWDNPGNWPDGGMVGLYGGEVKWIKAEPGEYRALAEALATGTNKGLILKHIPDANVEGYGD